MHWRDLPYCIYPDPEEKCFSGSTFVEDDRVIAMYFGTQVGNMVATSSDPLLLNWTKVANRAVIPIAAPDGSPLPYTVYDPCIWKKDGVYYSLSGWARPGGPAGKPIRANFLFRSTDLEHWEYLHPFVEDDFYTLVGDDGSVPYFWPIGDRHILLFASHMTGAQYLLGSYDTARDKFVATHGGRVQFRADEARRHPRPIRYARRPGRRHRHLQHERGQAHRGLESNHVAAAAPDGRRR